MTVVVVEADGQIAGLIGIRDELRPESAETVRLLRAQGIDTIMLTGDNASTANALARQAGITNVRAEQLPADEALAIRELTGGSPTAMVGDGINDAPALATATVGIAMGAKGAAAAIDSADVAFTGHDLRLIPAALAHARRGRRIMTVNIGLALAIIVLLFPLALFGIVGLAGIVLVHEVAEVVVILNGIRAAQRPAALSNARSAEQTSAVLASTLAVSMTITTTSPPADDISQPAQPARPALPLGWAIVTSALAGVGLDAAFPELGWWPIAFVSVTLALLALAGRKSGGAFLVALVYGGAFFVAHLSWAGRFLGPLPWLGLAGLQALLFAAGAIPIALAYRWSTRTLRGEWGQLVIVPLLVGGCGHCASPSWAAGPTAGSPGLVWG